MTETTSIAEERPSFRFTKRQSILLVFSCTLFGAAAQILIKMGAGSLQRAGIVDIITNIHLLGGYSLLGLMTVLLVLALRDGELSILYPVISLTFVWVTLLSSFIFREVITATKVLGISIIVAGVGVLGLGGSKK